MLSTRQIVAGATVRPVWTRLLLLPPLLVGVAGCGTDTADGNRASGYSYGSPQPSPHSGFDGKATVEWNGFTFLACPALAVGQETPLIEETCLIPGDAGASAYGDHSMLEPSKTCADGRRLTDAGGIGLGFVGEPLIGPTQSSPDRAAAFDCLSGLDR